jgi:sulfate adenylyltransferase subunit 2
MHVDTGLNFPEVLEFRDKRVAELGVQLVVASVPDAIAAGTVREEPNGSRNRIQTPVLLDAVEEHGFTALFGGARRDEDKARAKERVFSFRDEFGQWDPKNQRPELWDLYNGRIHLGESIRVFPLSNWTELDVWQYIAREEIGIPPLYLAQERDVVERQGMLYAVNEFITPREGERVRRESVRYRTVGDANLTAAVPSTATTVEQVIAEIAVTRMTERGATRGDDKVSDAAMEDRKKEGYF